MSLVSVDCPSCGATLPPREPSGRFTCDYCSAQFEPAQVKHAHDQAGHVISTDQLAQAIVEAQRKMQVGATSNYPTSPEPAQLATGGGAKVLRRTLIFVGLMIAVTTAVPAFIAMKATGGVPSFLGGGGGSTVGAGGLTGERLGWDDNGGRPTPVTIDGAAAFIGRTRDHNDDSRLNIDAYDMSGERKWRIGDLGSYSDAYQQTRFGVEGNTVLVSDRQANLRFIDLQTGEQRKSVALSDAVERICTKRDAADEIAVPDAPVAWIEQIDEQSFLVNVETGELTPEGKPIWCEVDDWPSDSDHEERHPANPALKVDGVELLRSYVDAEANLAVAAAIKSPGTEIPRAIGYDPKTLEVRWDEVVSKVPAASNRQGSTDFGGLAGGKYFAVYGEGQDGWHVAALDAETGASLWDVTLRPLFAVDRIKRLEATADHVFVVRTSSLEVLDAASGDLVLTIGNETYD